MPAIDNTAPSFLLIGHENEEVQQLLKTLGGPIVSAAKLRAIKKLLRQYDAGVLIFVVDSPDTEELALQVFDYIRNGLQDLDRIFLVAHPPAQEPDALHWIEDYNVTGFINLEASRADLNIRVIERSLKSWNRTAQLNIQHQAEKDLLMSVTRFSRQGEDLSTLIDTFSQSLAELSFAAGYCRIKIASDGQGQLKSCYPESHDFSSQLSSVFGLPELPSYLRNALNEKKPQIDLLPDNSHFEATSELVGTPLGSYLVFPLTIYNRVHELMIFLIPEASMDSVSMRQIEIISKAAEQLTMLLERREAERQLKKQYTRLKGALVQLKQTQDQLAHSEKMATVGQLAAGIAHEINNPLGFVMSNFGSLDEYLSNILQLQTMHESFLEAIEQGNQNRTEQIKDDISEYRGESDIDFIYGDIRDIVAESREGLNRVKEIISDLQSFSHGGNTKQADLDLSQALQQTLKILSPIIPSDVDIQTQTSAMQYFQRASGVCTAGANQPY